MNDLLRAADIAAAKTDRWMFVAVLLLAMVAVVFFARWIIGRYEQLMAEHRADQQGFSTTLININAEQNKTAKDLAVVLDRCACALEDNSTELRVTREQRKH